MAASLIVSVLVATTLRLDDLLRAITFRVVALVCFGPIEPQTVTTRLETLVAWASLAFGRKYHAAETHLSLR